MNVKDELIKNFERKPARPFLFIGSGFSRRYLGLEDWRGLLSRFCIAGKPFEQYLANADGSLPTAARLLAEDFNKIWWDDEEFKDHVEASKSKIKDSTSALRIEISEYLSHLDESVARKSEHGGEIELLSELNVDGIITTNWDTLLEDIFPDYKVYVGQQELLFSNPQQIGEIYKIHGSRDRPSSLVLTDKDYQAFNKRNAYLAAKLITIFVEHPIVFIGYSISDPNVGALLKAISQCIGEDQIPLLRDNLIFVRRPDEANEESVTESYITVEGVQIPIVVVSTKSLYPVYEAVNLCKRTIPVRLLRFFKEQFYELVKSSNPEKKLAVVDLDNVDAGEDVEFVVGVGVAANENEKLDIGNIGYKPLTAVDLHKDLINDGNEYDAAQVLEHVIPVLRKHTNNIPVFKYLRKLGIDSQEKYKASGIQLDELVNRDQASYQTPSYKKAFHNHYRDKSSEDLVNECSTQNAATFIPFLETEMINLDTVLEFLKTNEHNLDPNQFMYATSLKKLASLYDRLRWGW